MRLRYASVLLLYLFAPSFLSAQWTFYTGPYGSPMYQVVEEGNFRWLCTSEGLFRSNDGGQQYQRVDAIPEGCHVGTLWVRKDSLLAVVSVPGPSTSGPKTTYLYWSVNHGATWQSRPTNILADAVFKGIQYIGDTLIVGSVAHLWRSDDGGVSFQEIGPLPPGQGVYRFALSEKALIASITSGIYRSQDRGDSWQLVQAMNSGANMAISGDTLLVVPTNSDSIRVSLDLGLSWQAAPPNASAKNGNLNVGRNGRFYSALLPIIYTDDLGQSWQTLTPGTNSTFLGTFENAQGVWGLSTRGLLRVEPVTGQLQLEAEGTIGGPNLYFVKNLNGRLYAFTTDNTWSTSTDARHWSAPAANPLTTGFVNELLRIGDTLLMLINTKFYRSTNEGQSWTVVPNTFATPSTIVSQNGVHLVGDLDGIWRADNIQGPWTLTFPSYWITSIITTPDKWFACNFGGGVFTSTDEGLSWIQEAQLGKVSDFSATDLQYLDGKVYFFNENGLMRTDADDGANWETCPGIDPSLFYSAIAGQGNLLFMGTFGKGLYFSSDGGLNWNSFGKFENRYIRSATLWNNQLLVAVYDEGIWTYQLDLLPYPVQAFSDDNQNQIRDAGEGPFQGLIVRAKNGAYASSDSSGRIQVFGTAPEDSLFAYPPVLYITVTPKQLALTSFVDTPQIAVYKLSVFDLRISLVNLRPLEPGTNTAFQLICENIGSETQDAEVRIQFPPELSFIYALEPPNTLDLDSITWLLPNFKPGETRTIHLTLRTVPTVVPGNTISIDAGIDPSDGVDINVKDNTSGLRLVVRGSYDPNDKTARLGDRITPQQLADSTLVEYIIRFQNTGNYPATFIRITDTLQANFNPATFRFLGSSHPCQWELKGPGIVEFFFDDIQLPDSVSNEPESHGFVTFSIQPVSGLVLGDTLANTAFIYFDYNAPVQTNTAETVVSEPVRLVTIPAQELENGILCYPNPATQAVHLQWPDEPAKPGGQIWIWDARGRLVWQQRDTGSSASMTVQLAGWPAGWYRVGWRQQGGSILWGQFLKN